MLRGVSINQVDSFGLSTLHHAVKSTCIRTVLLCLPQHSPIGEVTNVAAASHDRHTALHTACSMGLSSAVHAIVTYCDWMVGQGLMTGAQRGRVLNAQTSDGKTALALACIKGWRDIVNFLCASGADVNKADRTMLDTPLHWATRFADNCSAKVLLANRADVDRSNAGGRRPYQELEVLKELRKPPRHDVDAANERKFGFERRMQSVDARYRFGKALM